MSSAQQSRHQTLAIGCAFITAALLTLVPPSTHAQARDPWVIVESKGSDKPFIAKILNRKPTNAELASQRRLLRITWSYTGRANGFPSEAELQHIARIEDDLAEVLDENGGSSKMVMSETGDGGRLWLFYVSERVNIEESIRRVSLRQQTHLTYSTVADATWNQLSDVRSRISK